ncbi:MAG: DUF1822 family protein [Cyanobacteria bacterium J06634_5]
MKKGADSPEDEGKRVDLMAAIQWLDAAVINHVGHSLREPEIVILKGTWRGLTYEQMSNGSEYSTNYLMRDVAPKLWKQLSHVFGRSVGKTNFRVALEAYVAANASIEPDLTTYGLTDAPSRSPDFANSALDPGLYWHPAVAAEPRGAGDPFLRDTPAFNAVVASQSAGFSDVNWQTVGLPAGQELVNNDVSILAPGPMYGYGQARTRAVRWLEEAAAGTVGHSRLIGVWGLGGVGKTLFVGTVVSQVGDQFEAVVLRSLKEKPTLSDLSTSILVGLGLVPQPAQVGAQLLSLMSQRSLLIVLEGVENILQSGSLAGDYQPEYRVYSDFFQAAMGLRSCIIVTGIEGPARLIRQGAFKRAGDTPADGSADESAGGSGSDFVGSDFVDSDFGKDSDTVAHEQGQRVRSVVLTRLEQPAAIALLQEESLESSACWPELIERYQGHPLALKSSARVIRALFNGRVDDFLAQTSELLTDVSRLLAPSFERLSPIEKDLLYWLASQDEPLTLGELQETLPLPVSSVKLVSALDSLNQRSLLTVTKPQTTHVQSSRDELPKFLLLPLVKAYAVRQLMGQFGLPAGDRTGGGLAPTPRRAAPPDRHYRSSEPIISLGKPRNTPVQLSRWLQGQFEPDWQSLEQLFALAPRPAVQLRNTYHLRDKTLVKRCKSIWLGLPSDTQAVNAFLLMAAQRESENLYKVCVQVQPAQAVETLPASLTVNLLDAERAIVASVSAEPADAFIRLPYFRGALSESFEIELTFGKHRHSELFTI